MTPSINDKAFFGKLPASNTLAGLLTGAALTFAAIQPAHANPPEVGSIQMNRMQDFADFIRTMKTLARQLCCNISDGRMGDGHNELKEIQVPDADGGFHYKVFVTRDIFGRDSHNPNSTAPVNHDYDEIITENDTIPSENGGPPIKGRWFTIPRESVLTTADAKRECPRGSETCSAPPNNVLWLSDGGTVYCYWPLQHWTYNEPKIRNASTGEVVRTGVMGQPRLELAGLAN